MAGIPWTATKSAIALTASTAGTILQLIAATNVREMVEEVAVTFNGITPTDPGILVEILTQTSAGTMSSLTPGKVNSLDTETLQLTAQHTAAAEPTPGTILYSAYANEQTGWEFLWRPGKEQPIPGGTRLGVRCTPGALTAATKVAVTAKGTE